MFQLDPASEAAVRQRLGPQEAEVFLARVEQLSVDIAGPLAQLYGEVADVTALGTDLVLDAPDILVQYLGGHDRYRPECDLAYDNQFMVMLWSTLASRDRDGSVSRVARRQEAVGELAEVGGGRYAETLQQDIEAEPDPGRERPGSADAAGHRQLGFGRCAVRHRPPGLDSVAAVVHVRDDGGGRHHLADLHSGRHVLGHVNREPGSRAAGQPVGDPSAARPPGGGAGRSGDHRVAQSVDRACAAEVDAHVDALGNQAGDAAERVEVHRRGRG
ncbi:MAG TPA: hypothetical protein DEH11_03870 [Actinobacteria bacterium]|nr:hypothetical protein [Actinomycetota bacterium]